VSEEFFDVLDQSGKLTGNVCPRSIVHRNGYFHATAHVWIVNQSGEVLLQKRSLQKDTHPGLWDISCAGHLSAGDTSLDAAVRELNEELGISVAELSQLHYLFRIFSSYISSNSLIKDNEFSDVYILRIDNTTMIQFCPEEISEIKYISPAELEKLVSVADPGIVCHDEEYRKIVAYLRVCNPQQCSK
jgi:isopentenyl-diphosphate delta-isomerase type 1